MELISGEQGFELVNKNNHWVLKQEIGFSPIEMLVASVGACSAYVYEKILTNSKITFYVEKIVIDYERDTEKRAKPVSKIMISFFLTGVLKADQDKTKRAIHLIGKNCPVIQTLDPAVEVVEDVFFVDNREE